jgi:hypothetical protein
MLVDTTAPYHAASPEPPVLNGHKNTFVNPERPPADRVRGSVWRYSRQDMDRETTRYLSAAVQLDVEYATRVVRKVISEPIRALAPAYGADVAVIARWAVDSLARRWRRDVALLLTILLGGGLIWWMTYFGWVAVAAAVVAPLIVAWVIVSAEYFVRWYRVLARHMVRESFDPGTAPEPRQQWIRDRIGAVAARSRGNLVVFRGKRAFVGSGQPLSREHVIIDVSRGRKAKKGKPGKPQSFTNADVHRALVAAMRKLDLSDMKVEERLFVNGRHLRGSDDLLPHGEAAPPAVSVGAGLLLEATLDPAPDARTYVCVEMPGWQGQLVVSLFFRAVHAGGSLYVEWEYRVLPPLRNWFQRVDGYFGVAWPWRVWRAAFRGAKDVIPALYKAPFDLVADIVHVVSAKRRERLIMGLISRGQGYDYGASTSIREDAQGDNRQHHFLRRDEIMFVLMSQAILVREVRVFLREHNVSLAGFDSQVEEISKSTYNHYNLHLGDVSDSVISVGEKSTATAKKKSKDKD